ncbi:MAG: hypothetical protein WBY88_08305 [Desulfosarcina sp.]
MNNRKIMAAGSIIALCMILWGCNTGPTPSETMWMADPPFQEVEQPPFRVRLTPEKNQTPTYVVFLLTIANTDETDLIVDWNESRYVFNGRPQGPLVFEGIDPAAIKNATVPPERIAPGATLSRQIMPLRLIAWSPVKEKTARSQSIAPGMLPAGENGIRLSIEYQDQRTTIDLSSRITRQVKP